MVALASYPSTSAAESVQVEEPSVGAAAAILIDGSDGNVLWQKNADEQRAIASTTKVATALVVLRRLDLDEMVTASSRAEAIGAEDPLIAELELAAGEKMTVRGLLYGLLLMSANDAAVALAERVAGSVEGFVALMNGLAADVGARNTDFTNPHGLDELGHHSTAADLALIAREAFEDERFREIVGSASYELVRANRPPLLLQNRNELLGRYPGANGIKTGQTRAAGRALIASATRNEETRISVVLGSSDPVADSTSLLDFGFEAFHRVVITSSSKPWGFVTFGDGRSFAVVPSRTVTALANLGEAPPAASFRQATRTLVIKFSGKVSTVPVSLVCARNPCRRDPDSAATPATALWILVAPLIRAVSSLL